MPTDVPTVRGRADGDCQAADTIIYPRFTSNEDAEAIKDWLADRGWKSGTYTQVNTDKINGGFTAFFFIPRLPVSLLEELSNLDSVWIFSCELSLISEFSRSSLAVHDEDQIPTIHPQFSRNQKC